MHLSLRHDPHSRLPGTPYSTLKVLMPGNSFHSAHIAHIQIVLSCSQLSSGLRSTLIGSGTGRGTTSAFLHLDVVWCSLKLGLKSRKNENCTWDCASHHFYLHCRSFSACVVVPLCRFFCMSTWGF